VLGVSYIIALNFCLLYFISFVELYDDSCNVVLAFARVCVSIPRPAFVDQFFGAFYKLIHGWFVLKPIRVNTLANSITSHFLGWPHVPETIARYQNELVIFLIPVKFQYIRDTGHCLLFLLQMFIFVFMVSNGTRNSQCAIDTVKSYYMTCLLDSFDFLFVLRLMVV